MQIGAGDAVYYEHHPPEQDDGHSFVFFNALTGDVGMWNAEVVPALRSHGHGTLTYNLRGQARSPFSEPDRLDAAHIVDDATQLLREINPLRPVLVGLSIGGLYAARAIIGGAQADALVLINTLRRDGPRLRWINDALVRCSEVGGLELFRDLFCPLLFNERWQAEHRSGFLGPDAYTAIDRDSGIYHLLRHAVNTDWDIPYERLTLPVLVLTGRQDRVFYNPDDVEQLLARLPDVRHLEDADSGHMLPAEHPAWLLDAVLKFTEQL